MPSLHPLWKHVQSHPETQNRLKSLTWSLFITKPILSVSSRETVSLLEVPKSSWTFREAASQGKLPFVPQYTPHKFLTALVDGKKWFNHYKFQLQFAVHKNQAGRLKPEFGWMLAASNFRTFDTPHAMFESGLHTVSLEMSSGISPPLATSMTLQDHPSFSLLGNKVLDCSVSKRICSQQFFSFCTFGLDNSDGNGCIRKSAKDEKASSKWPFSTSLAFHGIHYGLSHLPAFCSSLDSSLLGFRGSASSIAMQLCVGSDSATVKCNTDLAENGEGSLSSSGLRLVSAAYCLPHPEKQDTGGEDAYFICHDKQVFGVADGVGGWADMGVDAGEYARQLMSHSLIAAQQEPADCIDTARVLEIAHSKTTCRGASTACIVALSNRYLQAVNLGDSGFLVVRNGRTLFRSTPQQHIFNVPFQLENGGGDPPAAAEVTSVEVAAGDVVVSGTDGLFDNLYDSDIVSLVVQNTRSGSTPDITAKKIASLARERAQDRNRQTPFSAAAQDAGFRFYGGKMDDITVIVSYIVK
ncbi:hypothetical protein KP509_01G025300 [Ceratopteris richardii]|uniref:Protein phosphatase n=1 Tax=Ceratopteris richardii TaxID=49495 RepID=A0A8T2VJS0_CERRI|nr:hypothetical protein KP509_01G025300 [Ceratopteris richardii]KAH7445814.1 hypothetical protein KP509_01G025300 [Ceratopteris richardii]KAH7445815.1 hypothetical protein KP509_01G025300 [Ceratopteris richardii]KAH7445816.1 hypothetical protein KP509_01G025300 [Ceratopteris richardii]